MFVSKSTPNHGETRITYQQLWSDNDRTLIDSLPFIPSYTQLERCEKLPLKPSSIVKAVFIFSSRLWADSAVSSRLYITIPFCCSLLWWSKMQYAETDPAAEQDHMPSPHTEYPPPPSSYRLVELKRCCRLLGTRVTDCIVQGPSKLFSHDEVNHNFQFIQLNNG